MEGIGKESPSAALSSHAGEGRQLEVGQGRLEWREATVGRGHKTGNEWKTGEEADGKGKAAGDVALSGPAVGRHELLVAAFQLQGPPREFELR